MNPIPLWLYLPLLAMSVGSFLLSFGGTTQALADREWPDFAFGLALTAVAAGVLRFMVLVGFGV